VNRTSRLAAAFVLFLLAAGLAACSAGAEEAVLSQFFAASRRRDTTALASFAVVRFEPHLQGIVDEFTIIWTGPEQTTAFSSDVAYLSLVGIVAGVSSNVPQGAMTAKGVTIRATVRTFEGKVVQKTLTVTLQRALVGDPSVTGRWIIVRVREGAG
jgi:hypothetical protein